MISTIPARLRVAIVLCITALPVTVLADEFDHGALDRVLRLSVKDGRVDYASMRVSRDLAAYIAAIAKADPSKLDRDDRLAFWINAYNALVLKTVSDHYGIRRPLDLSGFFDTRRHSVARRSVTLNEIENDIIRAEFKTPLIHFGLVCAAISCPQLLPEAYRGSTVGRKLAENARRYLASPENSVDRARRVISLSKIFDWYKADFGGDAGLRRFLRQYAPKSFRQALDNRAAIVFREYDWRLNSR